MWLAAMLAIHTSKRVTPKVDLRECISCMPSSSMNQAAHWLWNPEEISPEVWKIGTKKWTCVQQKFFLKKLWANDQVILVGHRSLKLMIQHCRKYLHLWNIHTVNGSTVSFHLNRTEIFPMCHGHTHTHTHTDEVLNTTYEASMDELTCICG